MMVTVCKLKGEPEVSKKIEHMLDWNSFYRILKSRSPPKPVFAGRMTQKGAQQK